MIKTKTLHLVQGDPRENSCQTVFYAGFDRLEAIKACVRYMRSPSSSNIGKGELWKTRKDFDAEVKERGEENFVSHYNSLWINSPVWQRMKIKLP